MYHRFKWTSVSQRRNAITAEYEPLQPYFLLALMQQTGCQTFVDVGANIGVYCHFASLLPEVSNIVAFEANPAVADQLEKNIALNNIKADIRRQAVSDTAKLLQFGIVSRYAGNSAVTETAMGGASFAECIEVHAVPLDEALSECSYPVALKIDVEGHEAAVIAGAASLLSAGPCVVQVECYTENIETSLIDAGLRQLATIGPDRFFTNIPDLDGRQLFEAAAARLIANNHENKRMTIRRGGIGLEVSGRVYSAANALARHLFGKRL